MKKIKFTAIAAALVIAGGMSFAQQSMTFTATKEVFKTDVDNFVDENNWTKVSPEKIFAFTNFYNNKLSFGFAKNFGSLYFGTYFDGTIPSIRTGENANDTYTVKASGSGQLSSTPYSVSGVSFPDLSGSEQSLSFSALFGFGNIALKAILEYKPQRYSATVDFTDPSDDDIEYKWSHSSVTPYIGFGYTTAIADKPFLLKAGAAYSFNKETEEETEGTSTTVTKGGDDTIFFFAETSYEFAKSENLTQAATVSANYWGALYPKETTIVNGVVTTRQDNSRGGIGFEPSYKLTYNPTESLALGLTARLPMGFSFSSYGGNKGSSFDMGAIINTAIQYTIKPELAVLNLGGSIDLNTDDPITHKKRNLIHTESGNDSKEKKSSFFNGYSLDLSTGLTFYLTKNVVLDTSFDVINSSNMVSLNNIWTTALGLQLSIKY